MTAPPDPGRRLSPVVRLAPAKLNLTLAVLGIRPDGYHELHSVMVPLDLADRLSVSVAPPGAPDSLHVDGFDPGPVSGNLVLRAFAAARRHAHPAWGRPDPPPALAARLEKRIPVAAGLAGGSSDAAAAADAALEAWGVVLDPQARHRLATELGSDVPFFLAGGPALVEGRGERVAPLAWLREASGPPGRDAPALLLVTPAVAISTPAVFRAWDEGARVAGGAARLASAHLAESSAGGSGPRTSWRGHPCWRPPTTSRRPRTSSSRRWCPSSGPCCASSGGRSACRARAPPSGHSMLHAPRRPRARTGSVPRSAPASCIGPGPPADRSSRRPGSSAGTIETRRDP